MCSHGVSCVTASSLAFRVLSLLSISTLLIIIVSPQKNIQVQATAQTSSLLDVLLILKQNNSSKYQATLPPHS